MSQFPTTECGVVIRQETTGTGRYSKTMYRTYVNGKAIGGLHENESLCEKAGKENGTIKPDSTARR